MPSVPLRGVVRRWPVVLLVTIVLVAAAAGAALLQSPTYTASADVNVGRVDVRVQALPGYVAGAQALAAAYSRIVTSDEVIDPLARQLRSDAGRGARAIGRLARAGGDDLPRSTARGQRSGRRALHAGGDGADRGLRRRPRQRRRDARRHARAPTASRRGPRPRCASASTGCARPSEPTRGRDGHRAPPSARHARERDGADEIARLQVALDTAELKMQALGAR